jgi:hypothetical protein
VIPRQEQSEIATITVSYDVNWAEAQLLDYCSGVICHHLVGKRPGTVRAMAMPSLIDTDDRAIRRKIVPLLVETVVKEDHPAVEKYNRRAMTVDLRVQPGAAYLVESIRTRGSI